MDASIAHRQSPEKTIKHHSAYFFSNLKLKRVKGVRECVHETTSHIINKEEGCETSPGFLWEGFQKSPVLDIMKGLNV